jgi:hypothetical protein
MDNGIVSEAMPISVRGAMIATVPQRITTYERLVKPQVGAGRLATLFDPGREPADTVFEL